MSKKVFTGLLVLTLALLISLNTAFAANLPNVVILATGGTIAGSAASNTSTTGYTAGAIGIQTLIDAVPEMKKIANVSGEQVCNVGSPSITNDIL
jgi:L-asparaginase